MRIIYPDGTKYEIDLKNRRITLSSNPNLSIASNKAGQEEGPGWGSTEFNKLYFVLAWVSGFVSGLVLAAFTF